MKVLIGCEYSGAVRDAFLLKGHDAISCDLLPTDKPGLHYMGDVFDLINSEPFDLLIAFPPCTYLCSSGMHWTTRGMRDPQHTEDALNFVRKLMGCSINKICIENPVGVISTIIRKPDQYIQPFEYGHSESKKTGLWLKNLPKLTPTDILTKPLSGRWGNQNDKGQNNITGKDRWKIRSKTYQGIADSMADQWG